MTTCIKCKRPFQRQGKVAHLLCPRCRKVKAQPKGVRVHVVDEASVARMRCRVTTLCGRNADNVRTEGIITCGRCLEIMRLRARDAAYRRALAIVSDSAMAQAHFALDEISRSGFEQIAQELRLRADGRLPAQLVIEVEKTGLVISWTETEVVLDNKQEAEK